MPHAKRYAIIGAGIVGSLIAEALLRAENYVTVYEREPLQQSGACSKTAAAMLAPYSEVDYAESIIIKLGIESLKLWPKLVREYAPGIYFHQKGSMILAFPNDQQELDRFERRLSLYDDTVSCQISKEELYQLEPDLSASFMSGLYIPGEAQIDGKCFLQNLHRRLIQNGCKFITNTKISSVNSHKVKQNDYDWVIDCRGFSARNDLDDLRGVRGELFEVLAPEVNISRPIRVLHPKYPIYIVPRPHHHYLIGATLIESSSEKNVTIRSALELLSVAFSMHPGFAESSIVDTKVGVRPAFRDNIPKISVTPGCIRVNGLYRHGFLLAPIIAHSLGCALEENLIDSIDHNIPLEKLCSLPLTERQKKQLAPVRSKSISRVNR